MTQIEFNHHVSSEYAPLRLFALKLTRKMEDANDLVQETMFKAIKNREKFVPGTNLKGWLHTIMRNLFINNYRRLSKRYVSTDETEGQFVLNNSGGAINSAENKLTMDDINNALEKLNDKLRVPFVMSFEGYKYEEIAKDLNVPLGTVKIRIHNARKKLKDSLHAYAA